MNACGLALSQITYLIASLTKKNNKSSIVELNQVCFAINKLVFYTNNKVIVQISSFKWASTKQLKLDLLGNEPEEPIFPEFCILT